MALPLVIFDLDGTLVDSRADITAAVQQTLADLGEREQPEEAIRQWIGEGVTRLLERALGGADRVAAARAIFDRVYGAGLLDHTRPYPGVGNLLARLAEERELAVATNKPVEMARAIVDGLGWGGVVSRVVGARLGLALKPAPDMIEALCRQADCPPDAAVMVGDMAVDLESARAAGTDFIGVSWGYGGRGELEAAGTGRIADTAEELWAVLASMSL